MADETEVVDQAEPETEQQDTEQVEPQEQQDRAAEIEARYKKEIAGLNRKISELEKARKDTEQAGMTEAEKLKARLDEMDRNLSEQRTIALREQIAHRSGLDPEDMDLITASDEETITAQVNRILAIREKAKVEERKEYDRKNGRRVTTSKEHDNLTYADLLNMSEQQLAQLPPGVVDAITERALKKE